jgi:hypothetical protein
MVRLDDLIQIIFEEMDLVWLKSMWNGYEDTLHNMIEIVYLLYLLKNRL